MLKLSVFCTLRPGSWPYLGTGNSYQVTAWSNEKGFEMLRYSGIYSSKMTALCSIKSRGSECGIDLFTFTLAEMQISHQKDFGHKISRKGEKRKAKVEEMQTKLSELFYHLIQQWEKVVLNLWWHFWCNLSSAEIITG